MSIRRFKNKWKVALDNNLYYPELNKGTAEDNPKWIRESIQGFATKKAAEDYISKTVILEKRLFVEARDN